MRLLIGLFTLLLFSFSGFGQIASPSPTPDRAPEIVALLNDARLMAPELTAESFLKIAQHKRVDLKWRMEILNEAVRLVDDVQHSFSKYPIQFKGVNLENSEIGLVGLAFRQKLDRSSLKSKLIRQILLVDRERAKQLVLMTSGDLAIKRLSCEDVMANDVTDIYIAVIEVLRTSYSESQIKEGIRALTVVPWIENIDSPVQIEGALQMLRAFQGSSSEKQIIASVFARSINKSFNDDRSFGHVMNRGLSEKFIKILSEVDEQHRTDIAAAYRGFLIKNLKSTRCADNALNKSDKIPLWIDRANELFPKKELSLDDIFTVDAKGTAKVAEYPKSDFLKNLNFDIKILRGIGIDNLKVEVDKTSPEWEILLSSIVDRIASLKLQENENESDVFNLRSTYFQLLIPEVPNGILRTSVIRKYMRVLNNSAVQKNDFIIWYWQASNLVLSYPDIVGDLAKEFPGSPFSFLIERNRILK